MEKYRVGDLVLNHDGNIEIAGADWQPGKAPHPMKCVHLQGWGGGSLEQVLGRFFSNKDDLLTRIHAVEFSRHFSHNLNDRFSAIMPALEEYLKLRYTSSDEVSYIALEKAFFDWIDKSDDPGIVEFARKHIIVCKKKSPSLAILLGRTIDFVNSKGFLFPTDIAARLQLRRGRLFHSTPTMTDEDMRRFYIEVQAATGLLLLHTFDDLGVDISCLTQNYTGLSDFRDFLRRDGTGESAGQQA